MRFIRDRKELEHMLILMHKEGWSIRRLKRRFQMGRNTIRRILREHEQRRDSGHDVLQKGPKRASKLDQFEPEIKKLLEKYPDITGLRIYEELKEAGYPGGISILRERLKKLRAPQREPVIRFETEPGRQGQMDWSPYTIPFTSICTCTVQCFSYILASHGGTTSTLRYAMTSTASSAGIRTPSNTMVEYRGNACTTMRRPLC